MTWIESHQSLLTHHKTGRLARALGVSKITTIGHLHAFWWWCWDNAPEGDLSALDAADLADGACWEGDVEQFAAGLVKAGFVEQDAAGWRVHDWEDYFGRLMDRRKASAERQARYRERHVTVSNALLTRESSVSNGSTVPNLTGTGPDPVISISPVPKDASMPPPAGVADLDFQLQGLPGYVPTAAFYAKLAKYGALDLEEEAIKMAAWVRGHRGRKCSVAFVLNWLQKAEGDPRNGHAGSVARAGGGGRRPHPGGGTSRQGFSGADIAADCERIYPGSTQ